ncbi:MAG: GTP 3',8-cyclase MoaA [Gammaproteobacteria bacterium]|nr:MAG: GTP 3',8-cyclase MoaA [Gammaproteobacteria bacterium]
MKDQLIDQYGRQIKYLRFSVTDRCDLRCKYCLPKGFRDFSESAETLTTGEIEHIVSLFAQLGVRHVRITGGEPLVRKNIDHLVSRLARVPGVSDLSLSTNGVRLSRFAGKLKRAGLHRLNVSLDTLDDKRYQDLTGGKLSKVLQGLEEARNENLSPIKINCVFMRGVNEYDVEKLLDYCALRNFTLRLIETMPVGNTGRSMQARYLSLDSIKRKLREKYELIPDVMPGAGPARYYRLQGSSTKIGFITPISQHFCETCNRLRISCNGDIYTCLGDENCYPLGDYLRQGCSDEELIEHIGMAVDLKPKKHEFLNENKQIVRFMAMTGG